MPFPRKHIRLAAPSYVGRQWYFLTMCTEGRAKRFQEAWVVTDSLRILKERAESEHFAVAAYCFMPEHVHVLTNGTEENSNLLPFVSGFKQRSAYLFKRQTSSQLWQKKYYDHILRADERWEAIAWYIWMNPVRKGLCTRPEDWPFSGSFTVDWRKFLAPPEKLWAPPGKQPEV